MGHAKTLAELAEESGIAARTIRFWELANFFDTKLVRRFVEVRGYITNRADVVANGTGGKLRRWTTDGRIAPPGSMI
jgi:hypothetical protein